MSSAFPPDRMAACGLPYIEAVAGDLVLDCTICETVLRPKFNPIIPLPHPPSFDFGCYPFAIETDFDPAPALASEFKVELVYQDAELEEEKPDPQVGYCKPKLKFKVRVGGSGCGAIDVLVLADHNITLSGCQTINGIYVCVDDRVLTIAQDDPTDNDVWIVQLGAWIRYTTVLICNDVYIRYGSHAHERWRIENEDEPEHGSDTIKWLPVNSSSMSCRLRLTDPDVELTDVQTVDGKETADGNLIAVDYGRDAPNPANGIWIAKETGAWVQIYATEFTGDPSIAVLPPGTIVTVWDGYSSPWLYVVGIHFYYDDPGP